MKKYITGFLLLAFAVPSWAEGDVYFCEEEISQGLVSDDEKFVLASIKRGAFKVTVQTEDGFLALSGDPIPRKIYFLPCDDKDTCEGSSLSGSDRNINLAIRPAFSDIHDGKITFTMSHAVPPHIYASAGTCTKF